MADLPPVPHKAPLTDRSGLLTAIWSDWFRKLFLRVGEHLAEGYISTDNLASEAVTTVKIDDEAVTTAKIDDGAVSFAKLLSTDWTSSKSASGYQKLGSGLYLQWGVTSSVNSGSTESVTFPTAFPTGCLQVVVGLRDMSGASTSDTGHYGTGNYSASGFDIYNRTASAYTFNWIGVGY